MDHDVYRRMAEIQDRHWWYEARRQIIARLIKSLKLHQDAKILEAGCGPGANLKMLSRFGDVWGFEPDEFAINHCRVYSGVPVVRLEKGFLPAPIPFSGPFDLIGAFDVIEHVQQDADSLKALYEITKPGGYALFTVPAFPFLWSQHDVVNHHHRRYVLPQFKKLLTDAGYNVTYISYYNTLLFPLVLGVRMLKKALKIKDRPDEAMPDSAMNIILRLIFASERFVLGKLRLPFGVSIIAVCQRPRA
jgi:SAM-dependent methyltransferase